MIDLFFLVEWVAIPLYILMTVIILWYTYRYFQAGGEIQATYFELKRDLARRRQVNALTAIVLAIEFCLLVLGVQVQAVPYLETERSLSDVQVQENLAQEDTFHPSDTPQPLTSGGLSLQIGTPLGENSDVIVLTPTLTPTPVGTMVANPPPVQGCSDNRAFLEIPANGMRVFNPIPVRGTAFTDDFSKAKLEISGPSTNGQFVVVDNVINPVRELSEFSQFLPGIYEDGEYEFRLMVFDLADRLVASCLVTIYISEPPRTATSTPPAGN
jgi:hypothetical protein